MGRVKYFDNFNRDGELEAEANAGLRLSNHSYGDPIGWHFDGAGAFGKGAAWFWFDTVQFGAYGEVARRRDEIVHNAPHHVAVFSAGNDRGPDHAGPSNGPHHFELRNGQFQDVITVRPRDGAAGGFDTIGVLASAKNVLTVGSVEDILTYSGPASVIASNHSSFGPTNDGRIKPDVVASGVNLTVPRSSSNGAYSTTFSGTSAATPTVTGGVALLMELAELRYPDIVFGRGVTPNPAKPMLASSYKGLLIHTAEEAGPGPGPDFMFGWGLVNIEGAAKHIEADAAGSTTAMQELTLLPGETFAMEVQTVSRPTSPAVGALDLSRRVTLCWTDVPGTPPQNLGDGGTQLVNDLDTRVVPVEGGASIRPWTLNRLFPAQAATYGDNTQDNVERIDFISVPNVRYRITVSHKATLVGASQKFSLLTSGFVRVQ